MPNLPGEQLDDPFDDRFDNQPAEPPDESLGSKPHSPLGSAIVRIALCVLAAITVITVNLFAPKWMVIGLMFLLFLPIAVSWAIHEVALMMVAFLVVGSGGLRMFYQLGLWQQLLLGVFEQILLIAIFVATCVIVF